MATKNFALLMSGVITALAAFDTATSGPLKAAKTSMDAEQKWHEAKVAEAEAAHAALKTRFDKQFADNRSEIESIEASVRDTKDRGNSAETKVTLPTLQAKLEALYEARQNLIQTSRNDLRVSSGKIREAKSFLYFLNDLRSGKAGKYEYANQGPNTAAVERLRRAIRKSVSDFYLTLTNPERGGVGMPRTNNGLGGLAAVVKNGSIIALEPAEHNQLLDVVDRLINLGVRFDGEGRAEAWAILTAAAASRRAVKDIEAATPVSA